MAIKKSELYSSLWAGADALRGGMDASQYKDFVLGMLFFKYVSDKSNDPKSAIFIPEGSSFYDVAEHKGHPNIGEELDKDWITFIYLHYFFWLFKFGSNTN